MFRILSPSWSSGKMLLCVLALLFPTTLSGSVPTNDDSATKNHRLEKRIDDLMLYGGWQPVSKQQPRFGAAESRPRPYRHDLLAALPDALDASASYYRQALPKSKGYSRDIYSYYPRPAIRPAPRKNTPIYMETYKPRHHPSSSGGGHFAPQIIDIQKLDLRHLRDLHDVILKAQELPLSQLNIGAPSGKHVELVVQSLGGRGGGGRGGYGRGRQRGGGKGFPRAPSFPRSKQVQVEYIPLPAIQGKGHQQILPKDAGLSQLRLPHADGLDLKNIQIVEVEVPPGFKYGGKSQQHHKRGNRPSQHRNVAHQQKFSFPSKSFYPSKSNGLFQSKYSFAADKQQPEIEAQLIKLSEEQLKHLMKSLQVVDKHSTQDLYKYLPKLEKSKGGDIHLIVALPQLSHLGGSYSSGNQQQDSGYQQQDNGYQQQDSGYQQQDNGYQQQDSGYQQQDNGYQQQDSGYQQQDNGYQHQEEDSGYQQQDGGYQQQENSYETEGQQHASYPSEDGHHQHQSETGDGGYGYSHSEGGYHQEGYQEQSSVHQEGYGTRGHGGDGGGEAYIEVINAETEDGYKREPVLAVELKEGQTIEEAIQSLDPETLKKIGAHGKDGIEIEVVEVPMGEYTAESKKAVASVVAPPSTKKVEKAVLVPSQNGTTTTTAAAKT